MAATREPASASSPLLALCGRCEQTFGRPLLSAVLACLYAHPLLESAACAGPDGDGDGDGDDPEAFVSSAIAHAELGAFRAGETVLREAEAATTVALVVAGEVDVRMVRPP